MAYLNSSTRRTLNLGENQGRLEIMDKVGIIGVAQSKYEAKKNDHLIDLIFQVSTTALEDAGLTIKDIGTVVMAAHDLIDGRAISTMTLASGTGCYLKDHQRVADDGAFALALAYMRCLSGEFDTALVVSWTKCSEGNLDLVTSLNFDPFIHRPFGLNETVAHAIQSMSYMQRYGITEEQAAQVVVKNRSNALNNPCAHLQSKVTAEEVLDSRLMSWPLKELDLPPNSDGACALVLAKENKTKRGTGHCAWIKGVGWINDTYYMGDKELWRLGSLSLAAQRAYAMAGIRDPLGEIDVAEIHDVSSFHELMEYEALGFCREGEGGKFIERGIPTIDGELPINPSGGALSSNPYTAVGLVRVAEAALQVVGRAGDRQVPGVQTALAHGISGLCGQSNCVVILSKQ